MNVNIHVYFMSTLISINIFLILASLAQIEYLIGCDRAQGKTKNLEQNQYFVRVCMLWMNYICGKNWESFLSGI